MAEVSLTDIFWKAKEFLSTHRFSLQQGDRKGQVSVCLNLCFFFPLALDSFFVIMSMMDTK